MEFINTGLDERILKSLDVEHPSEELVKAMNKQGLVQKEVTVQGKNGTFTRKQWVKASEVKSDTSKQVVMSPEDKDTMSYYGIKGTETLDELNHIRNKASKELKEVFKKYQKADRNGDSSARSLGISAEGKQKYLFKLDKYIDKVKTMQATSVISDKKNSKPVKSDTSSQKSKDLSKMSESELKDRMKQVTTRMSELSKEMNSNSKAQGQLNSVATQAQKKEYDELVEENGNLMMELGKRKPAQQSAGGQKLSPADAKKKTQEITKGVSDKKSFMEKAKAQGITWKENDHEGINWMRCCMAMNKHFENGGSFDNSTSNTSTVDSSANTNYTPFSTQTPQSIKNLYGKSKPKSPRLNATHIFETSKKSLANSGKLSPSSLTILKKAHFQVASDNAYQTMLNKYKTGFERDAVIGYIGFYIKNGGFGTSSKLDQVFDKLSKKYNMSSTEVFDKSNKLYEEFMSTFDKYQVAIADNEFPEIKYELVSKVNRKYMNSK